MAPKLTLAHARAETAAAGVQTQPLRLTLEDLKTLTPRDLDDRLHRMGLSRAAASRVTSLIAGAQRAEKAGRAECAEAKITLVLGTCGRVCPNARAS